MSTIGRKASVTGSLTSREGESRLQSKFSDQSLNDRRPRFSTKRQAKKEATVVVNVNSESPINLGHDLPSASDHHHEDGQGGLADELDYITISAAAAPSSPYQQPLQSALSLASLRGDKASRILGIKHRRSMEPIPASTRTSIVSTRSARDGLPSPSFTPTSPLTSLYVVSGLPKSPHTWTLADPDSVLGLHHSDGAVSRWWRPEVLGSTVSPGAGGGKKKKRGKTEETIKGAGALSKQEVGKMLSKALKVHTYIITRT